VTGRKEGREEGRKEGRKGGRKEGREQGRKEANSWAVAHFTITLLQFLYLNPRPVEYMSIIRLSGVSFLGINRHASKAYRSIHVVPEQSVEFSARPPYAVVA
jgi:hypothetical protein